MAEIFTPDVEQQIRTARAASNAAIARHDLDAIASFWVHDVLVHGSAGSRLAGIEANRHALGQHFERRPDSVYVRTPSVVEAFGAWSLVSEQGTWVGRWTEPDGPIEIGGRYQARWRNLSGRWLILGEFYVPTYCHGGAYCQAHP
jgi:ketosteroid isomerase-like protein